MYYNQKDNKVLSFLELYKTRNTQLLEFLLPIYDREFLLDDSIEIFETFALYGGNNFDDYKILYVDKGVHREIICREDKEYSFDGINFIPMATTMDNFISDYYIYNDELKFNLGYLRKMKIDNIIDNESI